MTWRRLSVWLWLGLFGGLLSLQPWQAEGGMPSPATVQQVAQTAGPSLSETLRTFDQDWDDRRHDPAVVKQQQATLEALLKQHGEKYELTWRMARHYWWLADGEPEGPKMERLARTGWDWGLKAVKSNPKSVEGQLWTAVCIGQYSLAIGILRALANGLEGEFNLYLDKSIQLDRTYSGAAPLRTKGNYWMSLPWPKRDLDKALKLLQEALKIEPHGTRSRLYLAEALEKSGDKKAALTQLDLIIKARQNEVELGDFPRILARAQAMRNRLQEQ